MASVTRENLLRAFAGESQAWARYTFAAGAAKKQKLQVIEGLFTFTAAQEKEHGEVFYKLLKEASGTQVHIDADYPVDVTDDVLALLRAAKEHEYAEHSQIYPGFAQTARNEGFAKAADAFAYIAAIEQTHGDRFGCYADLLHNGALFASNAQEQWLCLNCGHVHTGEHAPAVCPACEHDQGYYIRRAATPFEWA